MAGPAALAAHVPALLADAGLAYGPDGVLAMGGVPLPALAGALGTPAYVYHADVIRAQHARLVAALGVLPHRVHFAVKANGNLAVLRTLRDAGAGADVVSVGELERALAAGFAAADVVYSGVGKTHRDLEHAVRRGVGQINVESVDEVARLAAVAAARGARVRVGIRVNPDVTTATHRYISTGSSADKFGVPLDQVREAARLARESPALVLGALAMHLGSQLFDPAPFRAGIERLLGLLDDLRADGATTLDTIDVGGGLGVRYRDEAPLAVEAYGQLLRELLGGRGLTVALEPGRFLVASAGVLLTEVAYVKRAGGKAFVIVDAAMNDLLRPSHYEAHHELVPLVARERPPVTVDVVGPVCESGDFLALDRTLPAAAPGEHLAILGCGAYGFTMASNYNARPLPPEAIVEGGGWWVARERQALPDLFRGERAAPSP